MFERETILNNDFGFPYIAYKSEDISEAPALIIQLHGAWERGNGGEELENVLVHGFSQLDDFSDFRDCVLVMPQCPHGTFWAAKVESLKRFIDGVAEKYNADPDRIYLTGLSMGGFGTWFTAMAYPEMFAAIAPCCGGGMPWNAGVLKMPVWEFHGDCDETVKVSNTLDMVEELKKTNPNVRVSIFEGVGHNSWDSAFKPELMKWLLAQRRK